MVKHKKLLNQPSGLYICALTEFWERLGFYSVEGILTLYLVHQFHYSDGKAFASYSALSGLLYAGPVIGGVLSDRFLNFNKGVIFGLLMFASAYALFLFHSIYSFFLAFSVMIGGNSYIKSNLATLAGSVYDKGDPRRETGFTLYYLFSNVGQTAASALTAVVFVKYGYVSGFYIATASLVLGLLFFLIFKRGISVKEQSNLKQKHPKAKTVYISTIIALFLISFALPYAKAINYSVLVFSVIAIIFLIYSAIQLDSNQERKGLLTLVILFVFAVVYWGLWMQIFTSITLFADRDVNRVIFGFHIPAASLIIFEGLGVIIFAPIMAAIWSKLGASRWQPSVALKFAYGFLFTFFSFLALYCGIKFFSFGGKISIYWIVVSFFLLAIGELCLSAIGQATVTLLAPKKLVSTMMGFWYCTIAGGLVLSNYFAHLAVVKDRHAISLNIYGPAFLDYAIVAIIFSFILVIMAPKIKRITQNQT